MDRVARNIEIHKHMAQPMAQCGCVWTFCCYSQIPKRNNLRGKSDLGSRFHKWHPWLPGSIVADLR